ncbi:hypothetical protein, partial [Varibaculum cambriense]|uniref:hypothetical protein n=1 Tax=Varibaculum cambriense TaxID=184870 RepID=UPI002915BF50
AATRHHLQKAALSDSEAHSPSSALSDYKKKRTLMRTSRSAPLPRESISRYMTVKVLRRSPAPGRT